MENNKLIEILLEKITQLENLNKDLGIELYKTQVENVRLNQIINDYKNKETLIG